jgi:hypothetical protein
MYPVGSDNFDITDFENTNTILDQSPGTLIVPNQASRPTGWGVNQNGRRVMQADQGIEWWWNQPSSTTPGKWQRVSPKGWLSGTSIGGVVSSPSTAAVTVASLTVLVPGGRPVLVFYSFLWATQTNLSNNQVEVDYLENASLISNKYHNGTRYNGGNPNVPPSSAMMYYQRNIAPTTQASITFSIAVRSSPGHPVGTAALQNITFDVYEI